MGRLFPGAPERRGVTTTSLSDGDVTSQLDGRTEAQGGEILLTFLFWSLFVWIFATLPPVSTRPSRPSAGIQQRWNGCLKRTIPSVKGCGLLWNNTSRHVVHPCCLFAFLRGGFVVSPTRTAETSARCVHVAGVKIRSWHGRMTCKRC